MTEHPIALWLALTLTLLGAGWERAALTIGLAPVVLMLLTALGPALTNPDPEHDPDTDP